MRETREGFEKNNNSHWDNKIPPIVEIQGCFSDFFLLSP
jgi:hypothetical protein